MSIKITLYATQKFAFLIQNFIFKKIFPHSVRMRENTDQNNSKKGHFLRSATYVSHICF